ncbi:hypothetical protein [uncultured Croceitalea sp.]|uniref:hypothetical protein n=1 Tax=uncultured Croceitalea sp. TaxID=1798908 RepID=UPI0033068641
MGFARHATKVLKANRALLHKRRTYKKLKESYVGNFGETQLQFKELTPFEQKKLRAKIIAQIRKDKIQNIRASILSLVILVGIISLIYLLLTW